MPTAISGGTATDWMEVRCIWDTGATNTVITSNVVKTLSLSPTGKAIVRGVNSEKIVDTYIVDIGLPNRFAIRDVQVTECDINTPGIDLLIGMNIIQLGDFSISNGPGKTVFTFAMPPFKNPVDLLDKSNALNSKLKK